MSPSSVLRLIKKAANIALMHVCSFDAINKGIQSTTLPRSITECLRNVCICLVSVCGCWKCLLGGLLMLVVYQGKLVICVCQKIANAQFSACRSSYIPSQKNTPYDGVVLQNQLPGYFVQPPKPPRHTGYFLSKTCHLYDLHCKAQSPTCNRLPLLHQTKHNERLSKTSCGLISNSFYFKQQKDEGIIFQIAKYGVLVREQNENP